MTKLRREKKLIPQEQKGLGDKGRRRFDTWSTAVSEMSPTPTTRPALIFKALSPADSTGPLPSSSISLSFLSSQISKHVSDSRYRAWPRVRQFLQDLEPGSIVCDVGKSAARALWSKWDSQSGTMANFMLCISSVCMYASLGVFKAG